MAGRAAGRRRPGGRWTPAGTCRPTARDAKAEYAGRHIPGAVFFDIDEISDHASDLPHMLPAPADFATAVRRLGVERRIDGGGLRQRRRVLRAARLVELAGHGPRRGVRARRRPAEMDRRGPCRSKPAGASPTHGEFKAHPAPELVRDLDAVRAALGARRGAGGGRPVRRPLPRRGAGAAAGPARRPHAGRAQPALVAAGRRRRHAGGAEAAAAGVRGRRRRSRPRRSSTTCGSGISAADPGAGAGAAGPRGRRGLRRLLVRMGRRGADTPVATGP